MYAGRTKRHRPHKKQLLFNSAVLFPPFSKPLRPRIIFTRVTTISWQGGASRCPTFWLVPPQCCHRPLLMTLKGACLVLIESILNQVDSDRAANRGKPTIIASERRLGQRNRMPAMCQRSVPTSNWLVQGGMRNERLSVALLIEAPQCASGKEKAQANGLG